MNFKQEVRLVHGPCSEAVGGMVFEDIIAPWSLKGECSFVGGHFGVTW